MTFQERQLNSMTFKAWKMKFLNFMTFQVSHDPCEPWELSSCSTVLIEQCVRSYERNFFTHLSDVGSLHTS